MWLRVLLVCGVFIGSRSSRVLNVHEDVMSFIMGCDGRFRSLDPRPAPTVPLARTDIDPETGIETERIAMVDIPQLKKSLQESVGNEEVVTHILAHVEENLKARHDVNHGSNRCTNIKIDVPPQKVTGLSEQLQAVVQQNNYQLLEQVNTLFTFKLNSFFKDFEELLSGQTGKLGEGLLQLQQSQQKVAENLLSSPKDQCLPAAGETRIFQSGSSPHVASPIPDKPPVSLEDDGVDEPIPVDEPLPAEEPLPIEQSQPLPIEDLQPIPVEQTLPFEEEPLSIEESFLINDPSPIEEPLPIRKRFTVKRPLPIEEPFLDDEPHLTVESLPDSDSPISHNSEPGFEFPPENDLLSGGENEPEAVEEEREVEPRRIGFRRRRPRPGRPEKPGRPSLRRRRPGSSNPPLTVSVEEEDSIDQQPPIEPPEEEEVPEEEPRASPKSRIEQMLKRRKLLREQQQASRG